MDRPWQSRVPQVIDDLVSFLQAATVKDADFTVRDGPWTAADTDNNVVCIGWSGFPIGVTRPATQMQQELGQADVTSTGTHEGLGPSILETMLISCSSLSRDGTGNMSAARKLAYSHTTEVGKILADRQGLAAQIGGVAQAIMGQQNQYHSQQDRRGALAVVTFLIEAKAYAQQ